jgi:hypothetical protein
MQRPAGTPPREGDKHGRPKKKDCNMTDRRKIHGIENLHILLWIGKDTCWCQTYEWVGCCLIVPTLLVAGYLTRKAWALPEKDEFIHNLAVCFWVSANSVWMIGEFFFDDHTRNIAIVFFALGLVTLASCYVPRWFRYVRQLAAGRESVN